MYVAAEGTCGRATLPIQKILAWHRDAADVDKAVLYTIEPPFLTRLDHQQVYFSKDVFVISDFMPLGHKSQGGITKIRRDVAP